MAIIIGKTEFDLTIRVWVDKRTMRDQYIQNGNPELEVKEELNFKTLSATEVIRKVLDYIRS